MRISKRKALSHEANLHPDLDALVGGPKVLCHSEERSDEESGFLRAQQEPGFLALLGMTTVDLIRITTIETEVLGPPIALPERPLASCAV